MRMLCTLLTPERYRHHRGIRPDVLSRSGTQVRWLCSKVGGMERESSGREKLLLQAGLYGMRRGAAEARIADIAIFQVESFADRRTILIGGQRRISILPQHRA